MFKFFLIFCFLTSFIHAQEMERSPATVNELKMTHYDKDSTANAVVLLEQHFITSNPSKMKRFTKKYYIKFKILNKAALNLATIKTPFSKYVELKNLQGFTYNLNTDGTIRRTPLSEGDKFSQSYNNGLKINTVTFPEVKVGSIIEYSYTIKTNYYSVHNCYFQSNIPKKKVIYKSQTIEQFYFSMFIGYIKPKVHYQKKEPKCMGKRTCEIIYYEFEDVPAFVEEDFTDNKNNYISRIFFEKIYYDIYANKNQKKYGWGLIDDYYRKRFDKKLKKVSFFKKVIPKTIKQEKDTLKKVTEIYNFIRDHYTLNTSYNNSLTKSFKERIGNYSDINLALYNSLKALNLKPSIAVLSTRNHGFLTKLYPTYQSINYAITHVKINGKDYFLDATDKNIPLGLVPFNCLNDDVRVLDFENGTYWNAIASIIETTSNTKISLKIKESYEISGTIQQIKKGQFAYDYRKYRIKNKKENYIDSIQNKNIYLNIKEYKVEHLKTPSLPINETLSVSLDNESINDEIIRINPFLINSIKENPLKLKERKYPVDFGFPYSKYYTISLQYPKNMQLTKLPEETGFMLPENAGRFIFKVIEKENEINIFLKFSSNKKSYSSSEYSAIKELFNKLVVSQNSYIEFKKL